MARFGTPTRKKRAGALAVGALLLGLSAGLFDPAAAATHYPPGAACYDCHAVSESKMIVGTRLIKKSAEAIQLGMGAGSTAVRCLLCHRTNAVADTGRTKMLGVWQHFDATSRSKHPVDVESGFTGNATALDCLDCHSGITLGVVSDGAGNAEVHGKDASSEVLNVYAETLLGAPANAAAVSGSTCQNTACHDGDGGAAAQGTPPPRHAMGKASIYGAPAPTSCTACHGDHNSFQNDSLITLRTDGTTSNNPSDLLSTAVTPEKCSACHVQDDAAVYATKGHGQAAIAGGTVTCTSCHSAGVPHQFADAASTNPLRFAFSENTSLQSSIRQQPPYNNVYSVCLTCHSQFAGMVHGSTARAGCNDCHEPHGAGVGANVKMVRATIPKVTLAGVPDYGADGGTEPAPYEAAVYTLDTDTYRADGHGLCDNAECHAGRTVAGDLINPLSTFLTGGRHSGGDISTVPYDCKECHTHLDVSGSWGASSACDNCHGYPPASFAHSAHVVTAGFGCNQCHPNPGTANHNGAGITTAQQFNDTLRTNPAVIRSQVNVAFTQAYYTTGTYTLAPASRTDNTTFGDCTTNCHGGTTGTSADSIPVASRGTDQTPTWNLPASGQCGTCHKRDATATPGSGVHLYHANTATTPRFDFGCQNCHFGTTENGTTLKAGGSHIVDAKPTVLGGGTFNGPVTMGYVEGTNTCQSISCHGGYKDLAWDPAPTTGLCENCHGTFQGAGMVSTVVSKHPTSTWANPDGDPGTSMGTHHRGQAVVGTKGEGNCDFCHANTQATYTGGTSPSYNAARHIDGLIQVNSQTAYQGQTGAGGAPAGCGTACHAAASPYQMADSGYTFQPIVGQGFYCGACHKDAAVPPTSGAHAAHGADGDADYTECAACHGNNGGAGYTIANGGSGDADLHGNGAKTFAAGVTYNNAGTPTNLADDTCTTSVCHSPTGNPASWVDPTASTIGCNECHYYDAVNPTGAANVGAGWAVGGSHNIHFDAAGRTVLCSDCHTDPTGEVLNAAYPKRPHVTSNGADDGAVLTSRASAAQDEAAVTAAALGTQLAVDPGNETCNNTLCHNPSADGHLSPAWGTVAVASCETCHNTATSPATVPAASHPAHVTDMGYSCTACHPNHTVAGGGVGDGHSNQLVNLNGITYTGDTAYPGGYGACTNGSCHVSATLLWGGGPAPTTCTDCHDTAADRNDFGGRNSIASAVSNAEYTARGHGAKGVACLACHSMTAPHDSTANLAGANPFRLVDQNLTTPLVVDFSCSYNGAACHDGTPTASVAAVRTHSRAEMQATGYLPQVDAWHMAPDCLNCHDPHGDGANLAMIQKEVYDKTAFAALPGPVPAAPTEQTALVFTDNVTGASSSGVSYADTDPDYSSLCQECHETADADMQSFQDGAAGTGAGGTASLAPHPSPGGNAGDCSMCHEHAKAFQPSGCNGCHGSTVSGQYWPDGAGGAPAYVDDSLGSAASHDKHVAAISQYRYGQTTAQLLADAANTDARQKAICLFCHPDPGGSGHTTNGGTDSRVDVFGDGTTASAFLAYDVAAAAIKADAHNAGAYNTAARTCSNVDCHYEAVTPAYAGAGWNGGNTGDATCETCHFYRDGAGFPTQAWAAGALPDAHQAHVAGIAPPADNQSKAYACSYCHTTAGYTPSHLNGAIDLSDAGSPNQAFDGNANDEAIAGGTLAVKYGAGAANATCSNFYCHGADFAAGTQGTDVSPTWNAHLTGACGACHDVEPDAGDASPLGQVLTQGKHQTHLSGSAWGPSYPGAHGGECTYCHGMKSFPGGQAGCNSQVCHPTITDSPGGASDAGWASFPSPSHVEGGATIDFEGLNRGWNWFDDHLSTVPNGTVGTLAATDICNRCHSTANVSGQVGATLAKNNWTTASYRLPCESCHNNTSPAFSWPVSAGLAAPGKTAYAGHGGVTPTQSCQACHDENGAHINSAAGDEDRIVQADVTTFCQYCHDAAVDDNVAGQSVAEVAATRASVHSNTSVGYVPPIAPAEAAFTSGCAACHDPHGSANLSMVLPTINTPSSGAQAVTFTARTQFDRAASSQDVCQVCHTATEHGGGAGGLHAQSYLDTDTCTGCHPHEYDGNVATADGFMPLECNGCHTYPGLPTKASTHRMSAIHDKHVGRPSNEVAVANKGYACVRCHNGSTHNAGTGGTLTDPATWDAIVTPNLNNRVQVRFDGANPLATNPGDATLDSASFDDVNNVCNNLYCHGADATNFGPASGSDTTPDWDLASTGACGTCHDTGLTDSTPGTSLATGGHTAHLTAAWGPNFTAAGCGNCHTAYELSAAGTHVDLKTDFANVDAAPNAVSTLGATAPTVDPPVDSTDRCSHCHSAASVTTVSLPGGGVGTVLAKQNWSNGAYRLDCLTCHNGIDPGTDNAAGTIGAADPAAPDVRGDYANYGAEVRGHNRPTAAGQYTDAAGYQTNVAANKACSACHDVAATHFDNAVGTTYGTQRLLTTINAVATGSTVTGACNACHAGSGTTPATSLVSTHGNTNLTFTGTTAHDANAEAFVYNCAACHDVHGLTKNDRIATSANIYMIRKTIGVGASFTTTPGGAGATTATIVFERASGTDSKDDGLTQGDNVCVACHTSAGRPGAGTAMTNADGNHSENNDYTGNEYGSNCSSCHQHNYDTGAGSGATADGFMPLQCNSCHTYPGLANLGGTHRMNPVHDVHVGAPQGTVVANKGFACNTCHYNSNHNTAGIIGPAQWGTVTEAHVQVRFNANYNPTAAATNPGDTTQDATAYNEAANTCSQLYCHGSTLGAGGSNTTPAWTIDTVVCGSCHDGDGRAGAGVGDGSVASAGNHTDHLTAVYGPNFGIAGCNNCHPAYAADAATHVNTTKDFDNVAATPATSPLGTLAVTTPTATDTDRCSHCHSTFPLSGVGIGAALAKTNWANASYTLDCLTCHNATDPANNLGDGTGSAPAPAKNVYWDTGTNPGHGLTSVSSYPWGSNRSGADLVCTDCHNAAAGHINPAATEDRLSTAGNDLCNNCHDGSGTGVKAQTRVSTHANTSTTMTSKYTRQRNQFELNCAECHDVHGSTNIFMIAAANTNGPLVAPRLYNGSANLTSFLYQGTVDFRFDSPAASTTAGTGYVNSNTGVGSYASKICQTCHTATVHFEFDSNDGHLNTDCIVCHKHDIDATFTLTSQDGFMPAGCNGCHGYPPVRDAGEVGSNPDYLVQNYAGGGGFHKAHVEALKAKLSASVDSREICGPCHGDGAGSANHAESGLSSGAWTTAARDVINIRAKASGQSSWGAGTYGGGTVDATGTTPPNAAMNQANSTCANLDCHGNPTEALWWGMTVTDGAGASDGLSKSQTCEGCHDQTPAVWRVYDAAGSLSYTGNAPTAAANYYATLSGYGRGGHGDAAIQDEIPAPGAANRPDATGTTPLDCTACHSDAAAHFPEDAGNLHRLRNTTIENTAGSGLCNECHARTYYPGEHHPSLRGTLTNPTKDIVPVTGQEVFNVPGSWIPVGGEYEQNGYSASGVSGNPDRYVNWWGATPGNGNQDPPPQPVPFTVLPLLQYVGNQSGVNNAVMCVTCHNPHGTDMFVYDPAGTHQSIMDNNMLRAPDSTNVLCNACH